MSAGREHAVQHWLPRELVSGLARLPLEAFLEAHRDAYFLLIHLFERHDSLSTALSAHYLATASREASAFTTAEYVTTSAQLREGAALAAPEARGARSELQRDLCFVWPLRPPAHDATARLSVGRARGRDLMLQHRSVSQLHAYFSFDAAGHLLIEDAHSRNKTLLDGERLGAGPVRAPPGAELRFGAVRATVAAPAAVWQVLHGEPRLT